MAHLSHHHAYSGHHVYSGGKSKHTNPTHRFPKKITVHLDSLGLLYPNLDLTKIFITIEIVFLILKNKYMVFSQNHYSQLLWNKLKKSNKPIKKDKNAIFTHFCSLCPILGEQEFQKKPGYILRSCTLCEEIREI